MKLQEIGRSIGFITIILLAVACDWSNEKDTEVVLEEIANPVFSMNEGSYDRDITVSLSCATEDAVIYYTTDGSNPTAASSSYSQPISIAGNNTITTIMVVAKKESINGLLSSEVVMATYSIDYEKVATPSFEVENYSVLNIYDEPQQVAIYTVTEEASIVYTLDGTNPKTSTTAVVGNTVNVTHTLTLKAYAYKNMMSDSDIRKITYTINEAPEKPDNVELSDITTTSVKVSWDKSTDNDGRVDDYHLYFKETGGEYEEKYYNSVYHNNNRIEVIIKNLKNTTTYSVIVTAEDNRHIESEYSDEVTFATLDLGTISDITAGNDPAYVYALDQDKQSLYLLDTQEERLINKVLLPDTGPYRMKFSDLDNKLYITSSSSGKITVYDIFTASLLQYTYSDTKFGYNIELLPSLRRIYVFKIGDYSTEIIIMDMDNGKIIKAAEIEGTILGIYSTDKYLFSISGDVPNKNLHQYSLSDDSINLQQSLPFNEFANNFVISPDGKRFISYHFWINSIISIYDHTIDNPSNVVGAWRVFFCQDSIAFSSDGNYLYMTGEYSNYDTYYFSIMDTVAYQEIKKIIFPNGCSESIVTANTDNTVVVGASNNNEQCFYFFSELKE
jgi:hypothetical protein